MSRAVRFSQFGPAEVLRLEEVADRLPGPGEVAIRVEAIGLNWADALWRQNLYVEPATLPSGLGNEAAGRIEAAGPGVEGFAPGDRVAVLPGMNQGRYPTYGERILAPATHVVRHPDNLSAAEAASAYVTFLTGYFAMFELAGLEAGGTVLVTGASSGTGQAALQLARARGVTAIGTTRSRAKAAALVEAGAAHVIVTGEEDLVARVAEITGGRGADLVYDGVGGPGFERLGDAVAHRGWIVLYGLSGGFELRFPAISQFVKSWRFHTYKVSEFTGSETMGLPRDEAALARALAFVNTGLADGTLTVRIDRSFPFESVVEAHRALERGAHVGKLVLAA